MRTWTVDIRHNFKIFRRDMLILLAFSAYLLFESVLRFPLFKNVLSFTLTLKWNNITPTKNQCFKHLYFIYLENNLQMNLSCTTFVWIKLKCSTIRIISDIIEDDLSFCCTFKLTGVIFNDYISFFIFMIILHWIKDEYLLDIWLLLSKYLCKASEFK